MDIQSEKPFRIAIVGGGIGGLFAALSIHHFCSGSPRPFVIDVYEQARAYREVGAGIGIGINATRLAHNLGMGDKLNAIAGRRKNVWITFRRYDNGDDIITVPLDDTAAIRQAPVHRAEYLDLLYKECIEREVGTLHINKKCLKLMENPDNTIALEFRDGTRTTADFVIGADGIHSVIREHYIQDNAVYSGQVAYRGVVPIKDVAPFWKLDTYSVTWVAHDRHILVYPISANRSLNVIAFLHVNPDDLGELKESWSSLVPRDQLLKDMAGFEEQALGVLRLMPEQVMKWKLNDRDPFEPWVFAKGKVVLLGDAAHAVLPHQGAGGGQAMEDGYTLGLVLRDFFSDAGREFRPELLEHYTRLYQWFRLPRAQKVQNTTREASRIYELQTPDFANKTFEECLPILGKIMKGRMDWIWHKDLDQYYEEAKAIYPTPAVRPRA